MTHRPHRLGWVPPFLVGAAAAISAEVTVAVLLYTGPGLTRSLTAILAVEGVALAGGMWSAPTPGPRLIDRLRRRWLFCLGAFLAASTFGVAWSIFAEFGEDRLSQGLGLAILAGLPLYAAGTVLGGLASVSASDPRGPLRGPGAPAALGAGAGFIATGLLLPRAPLPASLLVACIVVLSLAGMIFGLVLGSRMEVRERARRPSRGGDVCVEDRSVPAAGHEEKVLLEGRHVRRRLKLEGVGELPWDVAAARALMPGQDDAWRVLSIGGGASWLPRSILREHPTASVDVLERTGAVIELGREHFGTELSVDAEGRANVRVGNLEDLLADVAGPYDTVFVDTLALAPLGGVAALSRAARGRVVEALRPEGVLVWGPLAPEPGQPELLDDWSHAVFDRSGGSSDVLILTGRPGRAVLPRSLDGFAARNGSSVRP